MFGLPQNKPAKPANAGGDRWTASTIADAAAAFGFSTRTIRDWLSKGCPGQRKAYRLPAMIRWVRENVPLPGRGATHASTDVGDDIDRAKLRKLELANARADLAYRKACKDLIDRQAAKFEIECAFADIKSRLDQIGDECALSFNNETGVAVAFEVNYRIEQVCRLFASWALPGEKPAESRRASEIAKLIFKLSRGEGTEADIRQAVELARADREAVRAENGAPARGPAAAGAVDDDDGIDVTASDIV